MPSITRLLIALALGLSLSACQTFDDKDVLPPEVVYVEVEKMPELTAEQKKLLGDCPIKEPERVEVEELVRVAKARKTALANCNVDKKGIRKWFNLP